jgi:hypothetical protein
MKKRTILKLFSLKSEKDMFIAYGQNIENHLEKAIKPLLLNNCFKDALYQIKQINEFNLQLLSEDKENQNIEILDLYQVDKASYSCLNNN